MVINGLKTMKERSEEAQKLILWGFRSFDNYKVLKKNVRVVNVPVWLGKSRHVAAVPDQDVVVTVPKGKQKEIVAKVTYEKPVSAPVKKGQKIGSLVLSVPDQEDRTIDLFAANDVKRQGYFGRLKELVKYLLFQNIN